MRGIELAFLFGCVDGKFLEEIFVYSSNEVFFLAKRLVADLVDLVYDLFDIVCGKITRGESALDKASLELLTARSNAVKGGIQRNVESGRRRVDDGRPTSLYGKVVRTVRKGCVVKKRRKDFLIIGIEPLCDKILTELFNTVLKFLANETQEHERQHHIALFKERA